MRKTFLFPLLFAVAFLVGVSAGADDDQQPFDWKSSASGDELTLTVTVAPGHYFYAGDAFRLKLSGRDGSGLEAISAPTPQEIDDEFMGRVQIYPAGTWSWKFHGTPPFSGSVRYQGCRKATGSEPALCYRPKTVSIAPETETSVPAPARETAAAARSPLDGFRIRRGKQESERFLKKAFFFLHKGIILPEENPVNQSGKRSPDFRQTNPLLL